MYIVIDIRQNLKYFLVTLLTGCDFLLLKNKIIKEPSNQILRILHWKRDKGGVKPTFKRRICSDDFLSSQVIFFMPRGSQYPFP